MFEREVAGRRVRGVADVAGYPLLLLHAKGEALMMVPVEASAMNGKSVVAVTEMTAVAIARRDIRGVE